MESRKLVQHGSSSLTITLPKKWLEKHHFSKGQEVKISEKGSYLIIGGKGRKEKKSKKIYIPKNMPNSAIMHYIAALYRAGYDHVEINYESAKSYNAIEKVTGSDLNGFDIIENKRKSCIIQSLSGLDTGYFENILQKLLHCISDMAKDGYESIKENNLEGVELAKTRENIINRHANFCERILTKVGYKDPDQIPFFFYIIKELENIGDEYFAIFNYFPKIKKFNSKIIQKIKDTNDILSNFKTIYEKYSSKKSKEDIEKAAELHDKLSNEIKEIHKLMELDYKEDVVLHHLATILRRLKSCLGSLFSIMLVEIK